VANQGGASFVYYGGAASWKISELFRLVISVIGNLHDPSTVVVSSFTYELTQDTDLSLGAYQGIGRNPVVSSRPNFEASSAATRGSTIWRCRASSGEESSHDGQDIRSSRRRTTMNLTIGLYCMNGMLLLLHEIESAFEREWEILRVPGRISGFLLIHVPIILLLLFGLIEVAQGTGVGLAILFGIGGTIPFLVHELMVRRADRFNRISSKVIIYSNLVAGLALAIDGVCIWIRS
jgi:Family of unknown function (DUF6713)